MSAATGIIGGAVALATLQLVLSSQQATTAFGKVATVPASWIEKIMDATIAAVPDHSVTAAAGSSSSAQSSSAVTASYIPPPSSLPPTTTPTTLSV